MMDRINVYRGQISQLEKADNEWRKRVEILEKIVIHKDDKHDAFHKVN
jgi:flagellar biosynthesis chaperone FliJ